MSPLGVMAPEATAAAAAAMVGCCWVVMGVDGWVLAAGASSRTSLMDEPSEDGRETWRELLPRSDNDCQYNKPKKKR